MRRKKFGNGERESEGWHGAGLPELIASPAPSPAHSPLPTITVNLGKEGPDKSGGCGGRLEKASERNGVQRLQALLTNGCKKPDGSGRPSGLPPSWGGASRAALCPPLPPWGSLQADNPPLQRPSVTSRGIILLSASAASPPPSMGIAPHPIPRGWGGPHLCLGCPCQVLTPVGSIRARPPLLPHVITQATQAWQTDKISPCRQNLRQGLDRLTPLRSSNTTDVHQAVAGSLALCGPQLLGPGVGGGKDGVEVPAHSRCSLNAAFPPTRVCSHSSLLNSRTSV